MRYYIILKKETNVHQLNTILERIMHTEVNPVKNAKHGEFNIGMQFKMETTKNASNVGKHVSMMYKIQPEIPVSGIVCTHSRPSSTLTFSVHLAETIYPVSVNS